VQNTALTLLRFSTRCRRSTRIAEFFALAKPRVMLLTVFTAFVGLMIAPGHLTPLLASIAIVAIAAGAGAAGALNMLYDADIDAKMRRTAARPIPRGIISRLEAYAFGLVLAGGAVGVLGLALNVTAAALLAVAILFYVIVYTGWLKRRTPQNIVIGGAAGALPPMIGWAAVSGNISLEPFVLFLIIFFWTPPHFWALSLNRVDEYARAGVPMLPVVAGKSETTRQILIYSALLVPVSMLPWVLGFAGPLYGAVAAVCGTMFFRLAWQVRQSRGAVRRTADRLFGFSILYLFVLFLALLVSNAGNRSSSIVSTHADAVADGSLRVEFLERAALTKPDSSNLSANEV
jgi:protoheme IX farnesyltransferase